MIPTFVTAHYALWVALLLTAIAPQGATASPACRKKFDAAMEKLATSGPVKAVMTGSKDIGVLEVITEFAPPDRFARTMSIAMDGKKHPGERNTWIGADYKKTFGRGQWYVMKLKELYDMTYYDSYRLLQIPTPAAYFPTACDPTSIELEVDMFATEPTIDEEVSFEIRNGNRLQQRAEIAKHMNRPMLVPKGVMKLDATGRPLVLEYDSEVPSFEECAMTKQTPCSASRITHTFTYDPGIRIDAQTR
jgi:hypothetical protein